MSAGGEKPLDAGAGPATLADLEADGADLLITCERTGCQRIVEVPLHPVMQRQGRNTAVRSVRARCSACGSRNVEVRPLWRRSPVVVTNHLPDEDAVDPAADT